MTDYLIVRQTQSVIEWPQPWPIVMQEDGMIVSGRPDSVRVLNLPLEVGGEVALLGDDGSWFTIEGAVITSVEPYLADVTPEQRDASIQALAEREAVYRKALSR